MRQDGVAIGVDIGGTKTHVCVASVTASEHEDHIGLTSSWRRTGNIEDVEALLGLIQDLRGERRCHGLAVGAHGCDTTQDCDTFESALQARVDFPVKVVNDAELFVPAAQLTSGIGLVAGTGSIAVGRRADNAMVAAGGWGWILGDEGSASGLVREAVRAVRGAIDMERPRDSLYDALCASLGASSETEFGRKLAAVHGAADWGSHARAVFAAAQAGSGLALGVIREGARALAVLVRRVADRGADARHVVAAGGVIVAQPLLYGMFVEELAHAVPEAEPLLLRIAPVSGAVVLAQRLVDAARLPMSRTGTQ